ncbi:MAG: alpha/beta fold hydrolase [Actinomycetaceae bacterium]|nr:alpha/beta fold hydrolase [Actinomycetaceae bacterium]
METLSYTQDGCTVFEYRMPVPLDWEDPNSTPITLFAREIVRPGQEKAPRLLYLQGGPGGAADRPDTIGGWIGAALNHYRMVLMDQRGTGASTPLDPAHLAAAGDVSAQTHYLKCLLERSIIRDAEALRQELQGDAKWYTFGQSYGGFLTMCYLSFHPEGLLGSMITGGLEATDGTLDDLYRSTYTKTIIRNGAYNDMYPQDASMLRRVCAHLEDEEELLPTGEGLSARRFRTLGLGLGSSTRFRNLHYLLESPFVSRNGQSKLSQKFLGALGHELSFASQPLYACLHEPAYMSPGQASNWSANRVRAEFEGMEEDADPRDLDRAFHLSGEHIYPWLFDEDPALRPYKDAAFGLAQDRDIPAHWDLDTLGDNQVPVAAAVYAPDMYVPLEESLRTASRIRRLVPWVSEKYHHNGIRVAGALIFESLNGIMRGA